MDSLYDNLPEDISARQLGDTEYQFYDADTLYDKEGKGYRLQGVNALEVDRLGKQGEVGGDLTTEQAVNLANELGFTTVVKTGKMDVTGTREMIDLRDAAGRSFRKELAASGLTQVMPEHDPSGYLTQSKLLRNALKQTDTYQPNEFDKAAMALDKALEEQDAKTLRFKQKRMLPGMNADYIADVGAVYEKPGISNASGNSLNPMTTAWDTAMNGVAEAAYGMASLLGEKTGIEYLEVAGDAGVQRARTRIADEGKILTDYQDVNSFSTAVDFIANNTVMSIPYMAITALSAVTAPMTGGASFIAPVSIYTGQVWNEMGDQIKETGEERSASIAIAGGLVQAALDMAGIGIVFKSTGGLPKDVFKQGVQALMSAKNIPQEAAEKELAGYTKRAAATLLGDVAKVAREQLETKTMTMEMLGKIAKGGSGEAVTEGLQEATAAIAADIGSGATIDWKDVRDRSIQGMVAGGVLGGTFSAAGGIKDAGNWANLAWGVSTEDPNGVSKSAEYAREEEATKGFVPNNDNNLAEVNQMAEPLEDINAQADRHEQTQKSRSTREFIVDAMTATPALWRGAVRQIFSPELQAKYRSARVMADLFGGNLQRIFGGSSFENFKHHELAKYKNVLSIPKNTLIELNEGKHLFSGDAEKISQKFYDTVQAALDKDGNFNPDLVPDSNIKPVILRTVNELQTLSDMMFNDQKQYNPALGKINSYLLRYKSLNKKAVYKKRNAFIEKLKRIYKLTDAEATKLTDEIINGHSNTLSEADAFSVTKGGPQPGSHKRRSFNLSQNKEFDEFMERDLFANVSNAAKSAARYTANEKYVGQNGKVIAKLLEQMRKEGATQEETDKIAYQMRRYLDAESGNYHRPTSTLGKAAEAIQKSFMVFVTITGLPLATLSSFVELALTTRGLTRDQIFGSKANPKGSLSHMGKELSETLWKGMQEVARLPRSAVPSIPTKGAKVVDTTEAQKVLRKRGYFEWDVGAATTTGVSETHSWHTKILEKFFKWTGLQGWTNYTRAVRAAMAGDFIVDNAMIVLDWQQRNYVNGEARTNEVREAEDKLRNLGLDVSQGGILNKIVDSINGATDPAMEQEIELAMREAVFNFINEAVVLPQSANRPLMYQDPRLALFMQFQGFMSAFTANHIPRLWSEYIKRGSPEMRYNTFAMMTTMIMLGFASQYLKDLIKYGGKNPYLDENEIFQRGVRASGLLGTGERILDQFFPLYETRSDGPTQWIWNTATGESPTLGKVEQMSKAASGVIEGDMDKAKKNVARATLGPFYQPLKWAFDGDK